MCESDEPTEPDWDLLNDGKKEQAVEDCPTCFKTCCMTHRTHVIPHTKCILREAGR